MIRGVVLAKMARTAGMLAMCKMCFAQFLPKKTSEMYMKRPSDFCSPKIPKHVSS